MKFATLFLIASAVLALPTGEKSDNIIELAKKEAAPADGFRFPTEDEDNPDSENYRFKTEDGQVPGRDKPQQQHPLKNQRDNNNNLCSSYFKSTIEEIPEECMKSVFCRQRFTFKVLCDDVSFTTDNWTKQKLIDERVLEDCAGEYICKPEDSYKA